MDQRRILIVEDDRTQNNVLANFLRRENFEVFSAYDLKTAREMLCDSISLVVLDVILPDGNGLCYLKEIRKGSNVPVIVLTALDDEYTQINTFELKADEYVDKPVSPVVMTKRIQALMERIYGDPERVFIGKFTFDFHKFQVFSEFGEEIKLTTKEISIVKYLFENKGNVVTREALISYVWGYDYPYADRTIDTHIKNIRKKLDSDLIITVKSVGYRINS